MALIPAAGHPGAPPDAAARAAQGARPGAVRRRHSAPSKGHAIVVGHGRVGQIVCDMLERHRFPFLATDSDPAAVTEYRRRGREVYYGDAANPAFLKSCGADGGRRGHRHHPRPGGNRRDRRVVRSLRPDMLIVSRARDATHARHLYAIGVTDAVPETIEASLQLSEAALVGLGLPTGPSSPPSTRSATSSATSCRRRPAGPGWRARARSGPRRCAGRSCAQEGADR